MNFKKTMIVNLKAKVVHGQFSVRVIKFLRAKKSWECIFAEWRINEQQKV